MSGLRPNGSNADEWHLFLTEWLDNRATCPNGMTFAAVQIAEAIDDAEKRGADAIHSFLDEAISALETSRKALGHDVPEQCWATGPNTGDPFQDLIVCPGCAANSKIDTIIAKLRSARNG